jgi:SET domain-containing protein
MFSMKYMLPDVYVKKSTIEGAGLGVFANRRFDKGDIIEFSPFVKDTKQNWFKTIAKEYVFKIDDHHSGFGLGYTSLYNHQDYPNARFSVKKKDQCGVIENEGIVISAIEPIAAGDEIFISYGHRYWKSRGKSPCASPSCSPTPSPRSQFHPYF